jgi:hypothetical protein
MQAAAFRQLATVDPYKQEARQRQGLPPLPPPTACKDIPGTAEYDGRGKDL